MITDKNYPILAKNLLLRAKRVYKEGIFLGSPLIHFLSGHKSLQVLQYAGLFRHNIVLEVGCGCLRSGYWLIWYLDRLGYYGIEPNKEMLQAGLHRILTNEEMAKEPNFDSNDQFDFGVFFPETFDYVLACSIWSHASKPQIEVMLDQFIEHGEPDGKFLTSYIPATTEAEDYRGTEWVGRSHESDKKGTVRHSLGWIQGACRIRGLTVEEMPSEFNFIDQTWLCIEKV